MKRTIKFKAKRVDGKGWVFGSLIVPSIVDSNTYIITWNKQKFQVHPETVCQFTGLTDKNGNEIFEGDISIDENEDEVFVIQLSCGRYALKDLEINYIDEFVIWTEVEIIGNIHDKHKEDEQK